MSSSDLRLMGILINLERSILLEMTRKGSTARSQSKSFCPYHDISSSCTATSGSFSSAGDRGERILLIQSFTSQYMEDLKSQKYFRFSVGDRSYQITDFAFEFTMVEKKVRLMALAESIMIHQFIDQFTALGPLESLRLLSHSPW